MKVKFKNHQPRVLGFVTGHKLLPGRKKVQELEMTQEQLDKLLADETFRSWQKLRWCSIVQDAPASRVQKPEEPEAAGALEGVTVAQAQVMISATSDLDLLSVWHAKDTRKTLKKALEARIAALSEDGDGDEGEDGEGGEE